MFIEYGKYEDLLKRERQCMITYKRISAFAEIEKHLFRDDYQDQYLERINQIRKKAYKRWMYAAGKAKTRQSFDEIKIG